jgi:prepilin-type N-terminal cleavage/methylation domain-containing protein
MGIPANYSIGAQRGFTLVELMVSGTIFGLALTGTMAMLGTGRGVEAGEILRRQALQLTRSALEDGNIHFENYDALAGSTSYPNLKMEGSPDVPATLTIEVENPGPAQLLPPPGETDPVAVPYKVIYAKTKWTSPDGAPDSVALQRIVTDVK